MIYLELQHTCGDKKTVEVIEALVLPRLTIRWGLSGVFVLDVHRNYIQYHRQWKAADPKAAIKIWEVLRRDYKQARIDKGIIKDYSKVSEYQAMMSIVCFLTKWIYQS